MYLYLKVFVRTPYNTSIATTNNVVKKVEVKKMANLEIRQALKKCRMFNYELAELLGITEWTLSRKLRKELPAEEKQQILQIIKEYERGE